MTYIKDESSIYGFKDFFFQQATIEVDDVLVLTHTCKSEWFLELFRKNGIGMVNSHKPASEMKCFYQ